MTPFPLFDTGFTFWLGDVQALLEGCYRLTVKDLGLPPRELMARYTAGLSPALMVERAVAGLRMAAE